MRSRADLPPSERPPETFPVLDTLRAVGALAVLTTHTAFWAGAYTQHGIWGSLLARLDVGVALFFVLSGFLLSRGWIIAADRHSRPPRVVQYLWKRVLRIFPVYIVTAVIALVFLTENDGFGPGRWLTTLSLTDIYVRDILPAGLTQMWSLATELAFYVALPLLMLVGIGRRRRLSPLRLSVLLLAMLATSVIWLGYLSGRIPGADERAVNEWLPAFLGWFAVGIGLALLHRLHDTGKAPHRLSQAVERVAAAPGTCWAAAGGIMLIAATPVAGPTLLLAPTPAEAVTKNLLYAAVGALVVFTGVFAPSAPRYARLMSAHWLRHLGHISYGIFCIHLPLLHLVMWTTGYDLFRGNGVQIFLLTLAGSLVAAELLYRFIELPAMRFRNLPGRSATTTTAAETATTAK